MNFFFLFKQKIYFFKINILMIIRCFGLFYRLLFTSWLRLWRLGLGYRTFPCTTQQKRMHISRMAGTTRQIYHSRWVYRCTRHGLGHPRLYRQRLLPRCGSLRFAWQKTLSCDFNRLGQCRNWHTLHCSYGTRPVATSRILSQIH